MQTNRTIIFQECDNQAPDILTIIGDVGDKISLEDEIIWEIREKLEVHSAKEYLEKFHPVLYEYLDTEKLTIQYSSHRISDAIEHERTLVFHQEYWLIRFMDYLLDARAKEKNARNPFYNLWQFRFNRADIKLLDKIRSEWKRLWMKKEEDRTYQEKTEQIISLLKNRFDEGNFLLYYYLQDREKNLNQGNDKESYDLIPEETEDCEIERIGYSKKSSTEPVLRYEDAMKWKESVFFALKNSRIKNSTLLTRCLMGLIDYGIDGREEELKVYQLYAKFSRNAAEQYMHSAVPLLENYLNIKFFFQQGKADIRMALLVANCGIEKLIQPKYKNSFLVYLESVNEKTYSENTIWQAILPGISVLKEDQIQISRERFAGTKTKAEDAEDSRMRTVKMAEILSLYQIQSFISSKDGPLASFSALCRKGAYVFQDAFRKIPKTANEKWISPCYPNFTVIPEKMACFEIAKNAYMKEDGLTNFTEKDSVKLICPGIYVEAAYVAAGIYATENLEEVNLEESIYHEKNSTAPCCLLKKSNMPREVLTVPEELEKQIEKISSGVTFTFSREMGEKNYARILTERTMAFRENKWDTVSSVKAAVWKQRKLQGRG